MKIVAISDTHNYHKLLSTMDWLPPADLLIHGGDICSRGNRLEVQDFLDWFFRLDQYKYKVFIAGNHDKCLEQYPLMLKNTIFPEGVHYLNDSGVEIEGIKIWGSPIQPWFYNWAFNRQRGADIKKHWDLIPNDTQILVTHGPPFKILDEVLRWNPANPSKNVGCEDLSKKIEELNDLKVHIFGHIHEAYGEENINGVKYLNASVLDSYYDLVNKPHVFEI